MYYRGPASLEGGSQLGNPLPMRVQTQHWQSQNAPCPARYGFTSCLAEDCLCFENVIETWLLQQDCSYKLMLATNRTDSCLATKSNGDETLNQLFATVFVQFL